MEGEPERETMREASAEVSREFKTLIDHRDVDSLKQLQQLMYLSLSLSKPIVYVDVCINSWITILSPFGSV